jgi:hypothetical protein
LGLTVPVRWPVQDFNLKKTMACMAHIEMASRRPGSHLRNLYSNYFVNSAILTLGDRTL